MTPVGLKEIKTRVERNCQPRQFRLFRISRQTNMVIFLAVRNTYTVAISWHRQSKEHLDLYKTTCTQCHTYTYIHTYIHTVGTYIWALKRTPSRTKHQLNRTRYTMKRKISFHSVVLRHRQSDLRLPDEGGREIWPVGRQAPGCLLRSISHSSVNHINVTRHNSNNNNNNNNILVRGTYNKTFTHLVYTSVCW